MGDIDVKEAEFRDWLQARGAQTESGRNTRVHAVKTIERKLSELGSPYTTLADAWNSDRFQQLRERMRQIRQNARDGGQDYRVLMPDSQEPLNRLSSWNSYLGQYGQFLASGEDGALSDADRIRQYVLEHYIEPAREAGKDVAEVLVSDVNRALNLNQAWPNICQALAGKIFQELADVAPPERVGADQSSATVFRFHLDDAPGNWAEAELRKRYGQPVVDTDKMIGFALADGRHIALQRDVAGTQIWVENPEMQSGPPIQRIRRYKAHEARHSNLPSRLNHRRTSRNQPRPVAMITIETPEHLQDALNWYERIGSPFNASVLQLLKTTFLERFPDFENFEQRTGTYWSKERNYKDKLIERVAELTTNHEATPGSLGRAILDLLTETHPLLYPGMRNSLRRRLDEHPGLMESAVERLVRADDVPTALEQFGRDTWQVFSDDGTNPYADVRRIGSMICALVHPNDCLGIWSSALDDTAKLLTDRRIFSNGLITASEYRDVLKLGNELKYIMADEWGWRPRDLWDVHALIGSETDVAQLKQLSKEPSMPVRNSGHEPTNLILYGPPGTGKTYATAREAVRLCGEEIPEDREELMAVYRRLAEAGRIEFVTFHQSYSYEEFVEGLRPVQQEEHSAGFHLEAEAGVLRRVARRAETSTGPGGAAFTVGDRQVFKMSIGEAANPDDAHLFEEAIAGGYTLLGFEDIDWSDDKFANRSAIIEAVKAHGVMEGGEPNAMSGRVQMPFIFRNWVKPGDLIIVSKGNSLFRAIGEVTGEYQFVPREGGDYGHRRAVRWLWVDKTGVPVSEIYSRNFTMKSIYELTRADLNVPALERYIASQQSGGVGEPQSFVLIIDEINRANVSKVMGELITLLEPDKRIAAMNELRIRLPYSRDMFGLPANLHIIGTMNTADRSIALLDTALRRRFKFREVAPEPRLLQAAEQATGLPLVSFLSTINDRIEYLLDREHRIGHAYFIKCRSRGEVDATMRDAVIPLLQEYFFEDLSRVAIILGEPKGGGFLSCRQIKDPLGEGEARDSWIVLSQFAEDAYERCIKPETAIQLVEPAALAAE